MFRVSEKTDELVRQATASSGGKETPASASSSYAEYRSRAGMRVSLADSQDDVFWRYMPAPGWMSEGVGRDEPAWSPSRYLIEPGERRTLSKATNPAGGRSSSPATSTA